MVRTKMTAASWLAAAALVTLACTLGFRSPRQVGAPTVALGAKAAAPLRPAATDPIAAAPSVVAIYPRTAELPENVLRFYVYFSEPMLDGDFLSHIALEHIETGENLTGVFFDNIHELWSRDRKRITLLVDPGRVKTGLRAHRRLGRAFEAGQSYRLSVLSNWRTLRGATLASTFTATYHAVAEDRERVDVQRWQLTTPSASRRDALVIDFGEPVDHVSLHHFLRILGPDGTPERGVWKLDDDDRIGRFVPERAWQSPLASYALRVHGRFEDIAGNNLGAAFDHAVGDVPEAGESRPMIRSFSTAP